MKALSKMARYRKAIACAVGIVSLIAFNFFGVDLGPVESVIVDLVIGVLTVFGVYGATNS